MRYISGAYGNSRHDDKDCHLNKKMRQNKRIKIAFVYTGLGEGGISSAICALLREIAEDEKLDITLYLLSKKNSSRYEIPEGVSVQYPCRILDVWFSNKQDCTAIEKIRWYLVHIIGIKLSMKLIEVLAMRNKQDAFYDVAISYVNDINNPRYINMFCNDFTLKCLNARKKLSWSHNDPYRLGYTADYTRWRYRDFDRIVNVSCACKEKFDKIAMEFKDKSRVVHNCVYEDGRDFSSVQKLSVGDGLFHIVSVCRLDNKQKRVDRAVDACEILLAKGYAGRFVWKVYGSGMDEKALRDYARDKGVEKSLMFMGTTREPLDRMAEADVFVMTSDYEACSLTLLESLRVGTPVVVTDFPEAREAIDDSKNGFIVVRSAEGVADKLIELMENSAELLSCKDYLQEHPVSNEVALSEFYDVICETLDMPDAW